MKIPLLILAFVGLCSASGWSYGVPKNLDYHWIIVTGSSSLDHRRECFFTPCDPDTAGWSHHYPDCGKQAQSPINLSDGIATCGRGQGAPDVNAGHVDGEAVNNGHAIQVNTQEGMTVKIGDKTFDVLQFHFHFGKEDNTGSEHTVNNKQYPMEMHVVCSRNNGAELAVLGFFFEKKSGNNGHLQPLVKVLDKIKAAEATSPIKINLAALMRPALSGSFYRYAGSLTTPPCSEIVTWTVYKTPLRVSEKQLKAFRATSIGGDNFRPVQGLNGRTIFNSGC